MRRPETDEGMATYMHAVREGGEVLGREESTLLFQRKSLGRMAQLLAEDLRGRNFAGIRTLEVKKPREKLPDTPLSMGLARSLLETHGLEKMVKVIPVKGEKDKKKYDLTGDRAAAASYEWEVTRPVRVQRGVVQSLEKVYAESLAAKRKLIESNLPYVSFSFFQGLETSRQHQP